MKQKLDRYEMHKYWGKKPSNDLNQLLNKYSKEGDTVLDPFSGYGVFCCEAFLLNRNVISNDLNPIAVFINKQLLLSDIDFDSLNQQWENIKAELLPYVETWYNFIIDEETVFLLNILRDINDRPIKARYKSANNKKTQEYTFTENEVSAYLEFEQAQIISDWYPTDILIENSRISAKPDMTVADLFTKRTLACHARLLSLIELYSSGNEKDLLKLAFTANLANCSKLVPPIKSRGDMSQGAWMTGFYVGETYLENNVYTYFENRLKKVIKGKTDFIEQVKKRKCLNSTIPISYSIIQEDAKALPIEDESIDYVFTDPPYGDTVPYFEQSIIWNAWLKLVPRYNDEIVVSDSKVREKDNDVFEKDIFASFREIRRVLKPDRYFSLTYHSLSGLEWKAISNACIQNGFELINYEWLVQKTLPPRQINRIKTIKGDVLVTLKKSAIDLSPQKKNEVELKNFFIDKITEWLSLENLDTNSIFLKIMELIFRDRIIIENLDVLEVLTENFVLSEDNKMWTTNDKF